MKEQMNSDITNNETCPVQDDKSDDREGLGFRDLGPGTIGFVDEVNGTAAMPCPDFVPTRHELLQLAGYWADRVLAQAVRFLYGQQVGGDEWRIMEYGKRRANRVIEVLGWDAAQPVLSEVERKYHEEMGDEDWALLWGESSPKQHEWPDKRITAMHGEIGHGESLRQEHESPSSPVVSSGNFFSDLKKLRDQRRAEQERQV